MLRNKLVVVVENKAEIKTIAEFLSEEDFEITKLDSGNELDGVLKNSLPDVLILPVEMGGNSGIDLCHKIKNSRSTANVFVILLSSKKEEFVQIAGLESGADDFIFQPIHKRVLVSRIKALLKRKRWGNLMIDSERFIIDEERYLVIRKGVEYSLPKKEFEILSLLNSKPKKVFSRDEIKNFTWENFEKVRIRTVDVHIRKIREKIGEDLITTVKGVGYRIAAT